MNDPGHELRDRAPAPRRRAGPEEGAAPAPLPRIQARTEAQGPVRPEQTAEEAGQRPRRRERRHIAVAELAAVGVARTLPGRPAALDQNPELQPFRTGDIPHSLAAIERAVAYLGYAPTHHLEQGLSETVIHHARVLGQNAGAAGTTETLEVAS